MKKKRWNRGVLLGACLIIVGLVGGQVSAEGISGGTQPEMGGNGTDISAGVVVSHMDNLRFLVKNEADQIPIEGASVELYVDGLDKYVLYGETNSDGIYVTKIPYSNEDRDEFENDRLRWRIYKKEYLPYPKEGEIALDAITLPHEEVVFLRQEELETEPPTETETPKKSTTETPKKPTSGLTNTGSIPKTGVENASMYWGIGLGLCVVGALLLIIYLHRAKKNEK